MSSTIIDAISQQGMLPLYFHPDPVVSKNVLTALYNAGIRVVEYTNRGQAALENFRGLLQIRDASMPGMLLGIGTIKNEKDAADYHAAGADFLISPCFSAEILAYVQKHQLTWVPGCMTPSEINLAEQNGIRFVKLFPGNLLKPGFMAAIKPLFPEMRFMPTGGVELEESNLKDWFAAGVSAVGMGSKLITKTLLEENDFNTLEEMTRKALELIQSIK